MAPSPRSSPRWLIRIRAEQWSRDQDRALIAEGWDRFRSGDEPDAVISCAITARDEGAARARALDVLRVQPADVLGVGLEDERRAA